MQEAKDKKEAVEKAAKDQGTTTTVWMKHRYL